MLLHLAKQKPMEIKTLANERRKSGGVCLAVWKGLLLGVERESKIAGEMSSRYRLIQR